MKNKVLFPITSVLIIIAAIILLFTPSFFYDSNSNVGLLFIETSESIWQIGMPNFFDETEVYLPNNDIGFSVDDKNNVSFYELNDREIWPRYREIDISYFDTNEVFILKFDDGLMFIAPTLWDELGAGEYNLNDEEIGKYFDLYKGTEVVDKFENDFRNDSSKVKRTSAFILGNLIVLAAIVLLYKNLKKTPKILVLGNLFGIVLLSVLTIAIYSLYDTPFVATVFTIFVWIIILFTYSALNYKSLRGKDPELMFP